MTFIDARFPVDISYGSAGGPIYQTAIISMRSGEEKRNINWEYSRHEYDAATGVQRIKHLEDLIAFFHVVQGRGHTFRWKDWADYKSCKTSETLTATDQEIGTGDGSTAEFQIRKYYAFGGYQRFRNITLPVSGSVFAAVGGVETTAFTVDTNTGKITFDTTEMGIVAVDTANDWIAIGGDKTDDLKDGNSIEIINSTGNDGVYTISSTVYDSGNNWTEIHVSGGVIDDSTVDGDVKYGQPSVGDAVTVGYEFDVHARMDTDQLSTNLSHYQAGEVEVPVIEIKQEKV